MKTRSLSATGLAADGARHELCTQFARMLRNGCTRVRVRLHERPQEAWFYEHRDNTWRKLDFILSDAALVQAVGVELDGLASKPHRDVLEVRQRAARDWRQTDVTFQHNAITPHLDGDLESYLLGLLFRDRHDSKHDVRRRIQVGPRRVPR